MKEEKSLGAAHMETLPESVLAQIFENLSTVDRIRAEGVSHRWMEVLQGGGGWACQTSLCLRDFMEVACVVCCHVRCNATLVCRTLVCRRRTWRDT